MRGLKLIGVFLAFLCAITVWSYSSSGAAQMNLEPQGMTAMQNASCSSSTSSSGGG